MHARVTETRWLTPTLVRVVLGGDDLAGFEVGPETDAYVNLALRPDGSPYDAVFDPAAVREEHPRETWPARRRYTVADWDAERHELSIDFVVHGDTGAAGRWAATAGPGDVLVWEGPSGGYRPDPAAEVHLLVGDESALPAIAASLRVLPPGARAVVRLLCDGPAHEVALESPGTLDLVWLHRRGDDGDVDLLAGAVRAADLPAAAAGRVQAFVHGEADEVRAVRRHLLADRGMARADMSCSPYWRRTMTDEAWRAVKRDFVAAMEADA
ncbi:siderophore-interacting protein [Nocardioides sp. AX2bis]|uniref:siderophore-interacting protein n=1 Tax=Nocardioides sp. AX2bis TaxID=2653157 RepID=UPI0012F42C91|nr:siderophore-interacting protein [Nocardioides sp. AX2bis]VXB58789.1 FAD-binding protein [Nocardioides sp. AX2bis]